MHNLYLMISKFSNSGTKGKIFGNNVLIKPLKTRPMSIIKY